NIMDDPIRVVTEFLADEVLTKLGRKTWFLQDIWLTFDQDNKGKRHLEFGFVTRVDIILSSYSCYRMMCKLQGVLRNCNDELKTAHISINY
ncbi:hypothetical protein H0E87_028786, partial [Populus deltoides]